VDLVEAGLAEAVVAALVQRQPGVDDPIAAVDPGDHLLRAGHLRDKRGVDEADRLDPRNAGAGEEVDELRPLRGLQHLRLVLEPVARRDVADRHSHRPILGR
jgi:hypothetical protein